VIVALGHDFLHACGDIVGCFEGVEVGDAEGEEFVFGVAGHTAIGLVDFEELAVHVGEEESALCGLEDGAVPLGVLAEGFLVLFSLGDIVIDAEEAVDVALGVAEGEFAGVGPDEGAVGAADRFDDVEFGVAGGGDGVIIGAVGLSFFGRPSEVGIGFTNDVGGVGEPDGGGELAIAAEVVSVEVFPEDGLGDGVEDEVEGGAVFAEGLGVLFDEFAGGVEFSGEDADEEACGQEEAQGEEFDARVEQVGEAVREDEEEAGEDTGEGGQNARPASPEEGDDGDGCVEGGVVDGAGVEPGAE